jgi:HD-like signal output (HDOD) protein
MKILKRIEKYLGHAAPDDRAGAGPAGSTAAATGAGDKPGTEAVPGAEADAESPAAVRRHALFLSGSADHRLAFEQALESRRSRWTVRSVGTVESALQVLASRTFEAVVVETGFAHINPVAFLNEVAKTYPAAVRFVRSVAADEPLPTGFHAETPQRLAGHLSSETVEQALERTFLLKAWIASPAIRSLVPQLKSVPAVPSLYARVVAALRSPDASLEGVADLIAQDPVMTARMLQVANSAYFALAEPVVRAVDAVIFLGSERTKALILAGHVFSEFEGSACPGYSFEHEWRHSLEVASFAQTITRMETADTRLADQAFVAGLLHDVGKCLLAANVPQRYAEVLSRARAEGQSLVEIESGAFGTTHAELGGCLLGLWGLPQGVIEAVAWHHFPARSSDRRFTLLTAVHMANALAYEAHPPGSGLTGTGVVADGDYLRSLDLADRRNRWREACGAAARPSDDGAWARTQERRDAKSR